jgi:hypothetical protein
MNPQTANRHHDGEITKRAIVRFWLGVLVVALLSACGGGGGGGTISDGGIGGTGIVASGTITGFGSVFVNGIEFRTAGATISINDRRNRPESELKVSMVVEVQGTLDAGGSTGVATSITYRDDVRGSVQNIDQPGNTIIVLGQTVKVDNNTVFDGTGVAAITDLRIDDMIEVSGFDDGTATGTIRATRIEKTGSFTPGTEVEVKGPISRIDTTAMTFKVRNLVVSYASATLSGFPATGPANGQKVEVKGSQFAGATLIAVQVNAQDALQIPDGDKAEIEGLISDFVSLSNFRVSGLSINAGGATIDNPAGVTIANDLKVEVEGSVSDGVLAATKLSVRPSGTNAAGRQNVNIKIEAVASAASATSGTLVLLTKSISVNALTQLQDKSSVRARPFSLASITPNVDRLAVRVYRDGAGNLIATRVERTDPDRQILVQGPVDAKAIATDLTILGLTVLVGPSTVYTDAAGKTLSPSAFFSSVSVPPATPSVVEVRGVLGPGSGSTIDATSGEADIEG